MICNYIRTWFIRHLWVQGVAGYGNVLHVTSYLMCIFIVSNNIDRSDHFTCYVVSFLFFLGTFVSLFITAYVILHAYIYIYIYTHTHTHTHIYIYIYIQVSQEECEILRDSVPYVKLYRYNRKHLYPKLNGYRDNGQRKVWTSCISAYCTSTAVSH